MADHPRALLVIGIVLVTVPFWAPIADVTGEDHVYRTVDVTVDGGEIRTGEAESGYAWEVTDQIACFRLIRVAEERECILEAGLHSGNATVDDPPGGFSESTGPAYVVFGRGGQPYRRTVEYDESGDVAAVGLRPADPDTVLAEASVSAERAHPAVTEVLQSGEARTDERIGIGGGRLYDSEDGYAIVYRSASPVFLSAKPAVERALELIAVALGALVLYGAGRGVDIEVLGPPRR